MVFSVVLGVMVALGASPASTGALLAAPKRQASATALPSPAATPTPGLTRPGRLHPPVTVAAAGGGAVIGDGGQVAVVGEGGPPAVIAGPNGSQGIAVSAKNPLRAVAGGASVQYTDDGGKSWRTARTAAPAPAGVVALMIDPDDPDVWFFQHGTRLLRTRDAGQSWRDLPGIPNLSSPAMAPGAKAGQQVLWDASFAVLLDDNGQQVTVRDRAPQPLRSAALLGGEILAAGSDGHLYLSQSGGWTPASGGGLVVAAAGGSAWAADGGAVLGQPGRVSFTSDAAAATWTDARGLPRDQPVVGLGTDRAGAVVVAYCLGGDVYRSSDGGKTFTVLSTALRT